MELLPLTNASRRCCKSRSASARHSISTYGRVINKPCAPLVCPAAPSRPNDFHAPHVLPCRVVRRTRALPDRDELACKALNKL